MRDFFPVLDKSKGSAAEQELAKLEGQQKRERDKAEAEGKLTEYLDMQQKNRLLSTSRLQELSKRGPKTSNATVLNKITPAKRRGRPPNSMKLGQGQTLS